MMENELLRVGQWLYWAAMLILWVGFLLPLVREKSMSRVGALLGFGGTFMMFAGLDSLFSAFVTWMAEAGEAAKATTLTYVWHPLIALDVAPAMVIGISGAVLCWMTEDTAFFIRPGGRAAWYMTRQKAQERAIEAAVFKPFGQVVGSRLIVGKAGPITEIETTNGMLAIDGHDEAISKGLVVYMNEFGDVRVGGPQSPTRRCAAR